MPQLVMIRGTVLDIDSPERVHALIDANPQATRRPLDDIAAEDIDALGDLRATETRVPRFEME